MVEPEQPFHVFRFQVAFYGDPYPGSPGSTDSVPLCHGSFSECTGLEATIEPKVIEAGGQNYGAVQRAGSVSFATVVLKRGITSTPHLFTWFETVADGGYDLRLAVDISLLDHEGKTRMTWKLAHALPIKFKAASFVANSTDVGIEELHLAHEGLRLEMAG